MMQNYRYLTAILMLSSARGAFAQHTVVGRVTDGSDGSGLPGVYILKRGTSNGALTDANGNYSIAVSSDAILVFSFVGFQPQGVAVEGRTTINVTLQVDATQLDEVIVVGYGEVRKEDLTGSVTAISSRD